MRDKRLIENEEDFDKEKKEDEGRRRWVKDKKREKRLQSEWRRKEKKKCFLMKLEIWSFN
jgi:hypothetical protein